MAQRSKILSFLHFLTSSTLFVVGLIVIAPSPSYAQSDAGCAGDTWRAMANQAALQSRREDLMNKTYIVKADSVLQYSCFEQELDLTIAETGRIFSNGYHWVGNDDDDVGVVGGDSERDRIIEFVGGSTTTINIYAPLPTELHIPTDPPAHYELVDGEGYDYRAQPRQYELTALTPFTLEDALSRIVEETYVTYLNSNFNHTALSNTTSYKPSPASLCYSMASVWRAAKCKNFDGPVVFYSLEDLEGGIANIATSPDPRIFPPEMACES